MHSSVSCPTFMSKMQNVPKFCFVAVVFIGFGHCNIWESIVNKTLALDTFNRVYLSNQGSLWKSGSWSLSLSDYLWCWSWGFFSLFSLTTEVHSWSFKRFICSLLIYFCAISMTPSISSRGSFAKVKACGPLHRLRTKMLTIMSTLKSYISNAAVMN